MIFIINRLLKKCKYIKKYKMGKPKLELPIYNDFSVIFTQIFIDLMISTP